MLSRDRLPDLIVIVVLALLLTLLNYSGHIRVISDYPLVFLLTTYFLGRAVTWYVINNHKQDKDEEG